MELRPIAIGALDHALLISSCVQIADQHTARADGMRSVETPNSWFNLQIASLKAL
jgi:hypothetical protein